MEQFGQSDEEGLILRENATLIEQRGHAMMLSRLAGESYERIALRYGVSPDAVNDLIRGAIEDCLATRQHIGIQAELVIKLLKGDSDLAELYKALPNFGEREFQRLTYAGEIKTLREEICNIPEKRKLIAERRLHSLALLTLIATDTGELSDAERQNHINEILATLASVAREIFCEAPKQLSTESR